MNARKEFTLFELKRTDDGWHFSCSWLFVAAVALVAWWVL